MSNDFILFETKNNEVKLIPSKNYKKFVAEANTYIGARSSGDKRRYVEDLKDLEKKYGIETLQYVNPEKMRQFKAEKKALTDKYKNTTGEKRNQYKIELAKLQQKHGYKPLSLIPQEKQNRYRREKEQLKRKYFREGIDGTLLELTKGDREKYKKELNALKKKYGYATGKRITSDKLRQYRVKRDALRKKYSTASGEKKSGYAEELKKLKDRYGVKSLRYADADRYEAFKAAKKQIRKKYLGEAISPAMKANYKRELKKLQNKYGIKTGHYVSGKKYDQYKAEKKMLRRKYFNEIVSIISRTKGDESVKNLMTESMLSIFLG